MMEKGACMTVASSHFTFHSQSLGMPLIKTAFFLSFFLCYSERNGSVDVLAIQK